MDAVFQAPALSAKHRAHEPLPLAHPARVHLAAARTVVCQRRRLPKRRDEGRLWKFDIHWRRSGKSGARLVPQQDRQCNASNNVAACSFVWLWVKSEFRNVNVRQVAFWVHKCRSCYHDLNKYANMAPNFSTGSVSWWYRCSTTRCVPTTCG